MPGGGAGAPRHRAAQRLAVRHRVAGAAGGAEKPQDSAAGPVSLRRPRLGKVVYPGLLRCCEKRGIGPAAGALGALPYLGALHGGGSVPAGLHPSAQPLRRTKGYAGGDRHGPGAGGGVHPVRGGEVPVPVDGPARLQAGGRLRGPLPGGPG